MIAAMPRKRLRLSRCERICAVSPVSRNQAPCNSAVALSVWATARKNLQAAGALAL